MGQQQDDDFAVPATRRHADGATDALSIRRVNVGTALDQFEHDVDVAVEAGNPHRQAGGTVNVCFLNGGAMVEGSSNGLKATFLDGSPERAVH